MVRARLRRFLEPPRHDDAAIAYRITTLGLVFLSVTAAVLQQAVATSAGFAALALVPIGYYFSYRRRTKRNILLKFILAAALLLAFATFIGSIRFAETVDETRAPLVALFLWVQVLHSFDLPRARDLTFSVAASVALIALAGSLSFSSGFLILVVVYTVLLVGALIFGHEAELRAQAAGEIARELEDGERVTAVRSRGAPVIRGIGAMAAALLVATSVVFVALPRFPGLNAGSLPFAIARHTAIPGFTGGVVNPHRGGGGGATGFDPHAYFGYGSSMDLHVRGRLSDELVMRVRSPRPALYRAQVYDVYSNGRWTSSSNVLVTLHRGGLPSVEIPQAQDEATGEELVQTFYVERQLPNLIFAAYRPREVYSSSTSLRVDAFSSIRLPFTLEKDTIYSVVSEVPVQPDPSAMTPDSDVDLGPEFDRYLQLPHSLGPRFTSLAKQITADAPTPADKALAVQDWIKRNKRYRLDIPRDPPGQDPVNVFVFNRRDGFCEQIASTMALMLRATGVPTRLVTGFGEGQRNVFTGYWEIKNSDSHAWVEVYYRGIGWVPYDPTFGVPETSAANSTFLFRPIANVLGKLIPTDAMRSLARLAHVPRWAAPLLALAFLVVAAAGALLTLARRRRARLRPTDRLTIAWLGVENDLRRRGFVRSPPETVIEFARRTNDDAIVALAEEFGRLRYGRGASGDDIARFEADAKASTSAARSGIPSLR
jgi:transglutaminase-like putative cysteine protease